MVKKMSLAALVAIVLMHVEALPGKLPSNIVIQPPGRMVMSNLFYAPPLDFPEVYKVAQKFPTYVFYGGEERPSNEDVNALMNTYIHAYGDDPNLFLALYAPLYPDGSSLIYILAAKGYNEALETVIKYLKAHENQFTPEELQKRTGFDSVKTIARAVTRDGRNALHAAADAKEGNPDLTLSVLLDPDWQLFTAEDTNLKDKMGKTPRELATDNRQNITMPTYFTLVGLK